MNNRNWIRVLILVGVPWILLEITVARYVWVNWWPVGDADEHLEILSKSPDRRYKVENWRLYDARTGALVTLPADGGEVVVSGFSADSSNLLSGLVCVTENRCTGVVWRLNPSGTWHKLITLPEGTAIGGFRRWGKNRLRGDFWYGPEKGWRHQVLPFPES